MALSFVVAVWNAMKELDDIYPLTPMQEAMLLHAVGNPNSTELITQVIFRLKPDTNIARLDGCWAHLVEQHAVLRTGFHWNSEKGPLQFVRRQVQVDSRTIEVQSSLNTETDDQLAEILIADKAEVIDLAKAPLMRVTYTVTDSGEKHMIWSSHHLILDRWCIPLVHSELENIYHEKEHGTGSQTGSTANLKQFKAYVNYVNSTSPATALRYWTDYLADYRAHSSPVTRALDPRNTSSEDSQGSIQIPKQTLKTLQQVKAQAGMTAAMICQLAWVLTVAKLTRSSDVLLGVTVTGRPATLSGVDRILGCFVNNLPSRSVINAETTFYQLLQKMSSDQHDREPNQHVSLLQLNKAFGTTSGEILVETLFLWLNDVGTADERYVAEDNVDNAVLTLIPGRQEVASVFPLTLIGHESRGGLAVTLKTAPGFSAILPISDILDIYNYILSLICETDLNTVIVQLPDFQFEKAAKRSSKTWSVVNQPPDRLSSTDSSTEPSLVADRAKGREPLEKSYVIQVIEREWMNVLKLDELDTASSFFELGGSSLDAAILHTRVESMLRCSIPIISLYRNPYFADMVDLIVNNDWSMKSDICMSIRATGSSLPLFCVASPDVNTIGFAQLANHMSEDIPVFVLQAPPENENIQALSPADLPALAERYVEAMKTVQPDGPYNLLGMCTGSQLTFEMAKVLEKTDEPCGLLAILNTWALFTVSWSYRLQQAYARYQLLKQERWLDWPDVIWRRLIVRRIFQPARQRIAPLFAVLKQALLTSLIANGGSSSSANSVSDVSAAGPQSTPETNLATDSTSGRKRDSRAQSRIKTQASEPNQPIDEWVHVYGWHRLLQPVPKLQKKLTVFKIDSQPFWRIRSEHLGWELHAESIKTKELGCDDHHNLLREPWIAELASSIESSLLEEK